MLYQLVSLGCHPLVAVRRCATDRPALARCLAIYPSPAGHGLINGIRGLTL